MESKDMSKAKAVSTNKVKKSREDWIFDIILYTIGVLLIIITLYPMYFIVIASFSDPAAVSNGQIMFQKELTSKDTNSWRAMQSCGPATVIRLLT